MSRSSVSRLQPKLITIVDSRNVLIGAQTEMDSTTGVTRRDPTVRLKVAQFVDFLANDRVFAKQIIASADNGQCGNIWKLWRDQSFEAHVLPGFAGSEVAVDDVMHALALNELHKDFGGPRILQLVTGDGNNNHGRTNFRDVVVAALRKSVPVEIYAFSHSCSRQLRALERQHSSSVKIIELDPYRDSLIFHEPLRAPPGGSITTITERSASAVAHQLHSWLVERHDGGPMLTSAPLADFYRAHPGAREVIQGAKVPMHAAGIRSFVAAHSTLLRSDSSAEGQAAIAAVVGSASPPIAAAGGSTPVAQQASVEDDESSTSSGGWEQVNLVMKLSLQEAFLCPISGEVMIDPVFTADGHTYERATIEQWFAVTRGRGGGPPTSPMTNEALAHNELVPNIVLRQQIRAMAE